MSLPTVRHTILTVTLATACLVVPNPLGAQTVTYSGEAVVVSARALGLVNVSLSDTGPLPSSGGSLSAQLANIAVPGLLDAELLTGTTTGQNSQTNSQASVAKISVGVAGISIVASVLTSNATAACYPDHASVNGASTIASLTVNGQSIKVTGAPNQTVPLLVGSLVINEQTSSVNNSPVSTSADMLVNALHLKVAGVADVVVSSSHAAVSCPMLVPE